MTIEEKAKAYDEAFERCKQWASGTWGHSVDDSPKDIAEFIFPQLVEREDERIIRAIIDALYSHTNSINLLSSRGYQMGNIEAWLEKQKYERMKPVYDNQDSFESALEKAWKDYNDSGARTVDGCEDDYVECAHAKGFREGYLFGLEKQKEQKYPNGCFTCDEYKKGYEEGRRNGFTAGYNKAMKEVEQKEQKPAEWSEEDEERLINTSISFLKDFADKGYENAVECIDWLKSLRPQPRWKPTEEQMEELNKMRTLNPGLDALYQQLKNM